MISLDNNSISLPGRLKAPPKKTGRESGIAERECDGVRLVVWSSFQEGDRTHQREYFFGTAVISTHKNSHLVSRSPPTNCR